MTVLVGLDVGTSSVKGLAVDERGAVLAAAEEPHPLATPRPGWTEQDPEDWWRGAERVLAALRARAGAPAGIGLSGQMHGLVALEHASGVRSHLWMSVVAPLAGPRFRVSGLRAGFASDGLDAQEAQLRDGMRPGDPGYGVRPPLDRGRYEAFYAGVVAWRRDGAPPPVDPHESLAALRVVDAARRSAQSGQVVELAA